MARLLLSILVVAVVLHVCIASYNQNNKRGYGYKRGHVSHGQRNYGYKRGHVSHGKRIYNNHGYRGSYNNKRVYKPYNNGKYYGTYNRKNYYCSRPSTIHYGGYHESAKKSWPVGSYVNYYCSPGYKLVGYSKAECKYNYKTYKGYWTYAAPKCVRKYLMN